MTTKFSKYSLFFLLFIASAVVQAETFRTSVVTEININKSIEKVFDYATTAENWKKWHPNTFAATGATDHSATENEEIIETLKVGPVVGPKLYWTVTEHIVPNKWRLLGHDRSGIIKVDLTYTLSMNEDGSTHFRRDMVWDMQRNIVNRFFNVFGFKGYNQAVSARAVRQLKAAIEADTKQ